MELLLVPYLLALGATGFTWLMDRRQHDAEERRVHVEQEIELDRAREAAFREYIDRITHLIETGLCKSEPESPERGIARAWTLTTLRQLDGDRKGLLLQFLYDACLIGSEEVDTRQEVIVTLNKGDFRNAKLGGVILYGANLCGAVLAKADLRGSFLVEIALDQADLTEAVLAEATLAGSSLYATNLHKANLERSELIDACLYRADLTKSSLARANLHGANLREANLTDANLEKAHLPEVDLTGADLTEANLSGAYLLKSRVTREQLAVVRTIQGATLPDGTKLE